MKLEVKKLELNPSTSNLVYALMGIGVLSFLAGLMIDAPRAWFAYLLNHALFLGLGIGGLFFLVIHYLTSAGWNVAVRRVSESLASYVFFGAIFSFILLFGLSKIYPWTDLEFMMKEHVLQHKIGYFSTGFYGFRVLLFFAVITFFAWKLIGNSTSQDKEGGLARSQSQKPLAALFLVLFAPLFTGFAVDLIKSLDPKWFSTMFGVYVFIGYAQASVAATILVIRMLQKSGYLKEVTADHFHDLGKYLLGFSIFWAYIAVSQYLLIWYANLPEEITYYMARQTPGWVWFSILLPVVRFLIPFVTLLPRMSKRTPAFLEKICYVVILGEWIDLNWMIMPTISPKGFSLTFWDLGLFLGFLGFFAFAVRRFLSSQSLVPVKDPYLHETLHHHVM